MLREQAREAEPLLRQAIAIAEQVDAKAVTGRALCNLGDVLITYGRAEEALVAHREALQLCRDYGTAVDACISYLNYSAALGFCGRYDEADRVAADGIAYATETGHVNFYGAAITNNRIHALFNGGRWREPNSYGRSSPTPPETNAWRHGQAYVLIGQDAYRDGRSRHAARGDRRRRRCPVRPDVDPRRTGR
jgi:tetratricopeptide (TPR) repeat protein